MYKYRVTIYQEGFDEYGRRIFDSSIVYAKTEGEALLRMVCTQVVVRTINKINRVEVTKLGKLNSKDINKLVEAYYLEG